MRTVTEIRSVLNLILDKMEVIEEQGFIEEMLMLGAFCDGLAFCLGEDTNKDYVAEAKRLAKRNIKTMKNPPPKSDWKAV